MRLVYQGRKYYDPDLVEIMVNGSKKDKPAEAEGLAANQIILSYQTRARWDRCS